MKKMLQRISLCLVLVLCLSVCSVLVTAAAETPQITYEFSTDVPGRADGTISVTNLGSIGKNFSLGWGTSKKLLSKYSSSNLVTGAEMKGSDTLKFTLEPFTCIPSGATHLWLSSGGKLIVSYEIPQERRLAKEEPLYRFGVVSDIHIGTGASVPNFESAMQIFKMNKASFVISAGDNTENGKENLWQSLSEMANKYNTIPFWFVFGNHDALAWNLQVTPEESMSYCKKFFPNYANENHSYGEAFDVSVSDANPNYDYLFTYQGDLYVFMGIGAASNSSEDKNIDQRLSQSQIDWLDKTLSEYYKSRPTDGFSLPAITLRMNPGRPMPELMRILLKSFTRF
ncbi:MAG: metallophosphoesterase [Clostridia bacterium]|nr:metallophosphoesterase [Clostridia bacterium]